MNGKYLSEVINFKRDIEPFQVIRIYSGVGSGKNYWVETLAQMGYNILLITSRKATADAQAQKLGGQRWIDLETLLQKHSLILIDTDFETPIGYFKESMETYLVQSLDILTIQPLTAFLRELKAKNVLDEKKLRIILNKVVRIRGISEKTIIGGMAYYNDPAMSFMTELFDRNLIKYISIPFEEEIYAKYLEGIIECEVTLKGYSKTFMQILKELASMVYQGGGQGAGSYKPPSIQNNGFSQSMNDTLDQMKRSF